MPNFKLRYEDSENIKADHVNTVIFNSIKSNVKRFFWDSRYDYFCFDFQRISLSSIAETS